MAASTYYEYALAVSHRSGVFFSHDRRDAEQFGEDGVSPTTILSLRSWLEDRGWFVPLDKGSKRKRNRSSGLYLSIRYRILRHDEWAATHPGKCRYPKSPDVESTSGDNPPAPDSVAGPAPDSVAGEQSPAPDSGQACTSFRDHQHQILVHSLVVESEESKSENNSAAKSAAPVLPEWMPLPQWNAFLDYRKQSKKRMTPYAQSLAIEVLADLRSQGHDPASVLKQSILNGWTGLFPFRKDSPKSLGPAGRTIPFVTSEFGPRKPRDPQTQAAIEAIGIAHGYQPRRSSSNPASVTVEDYAARRRHNRDVLGLPCLTCNARPCICQ
jgi:hypothetical protein